MSWILVTPARNEADRLPGLAATLAAQTVDLIALWVVVDDGSTDGTSTCLPYGLPFPVHVLSRENQGGLAGASEFAAFLCGADAGLALRPDATRVMKVDADVRLAPDYLAALADVPDAVGIVAGRIDESEEPARADHTRGALKCYSRNAYALVRQLPIALGWDVLDEVAVRSAGLRVQVVPEARSTVARHTGTSEGGLLRGRRRAGVVSRWTGYHPIYFALRLARYSLKRPIVAGSAVMAWAYVTAGSGPFSASLRARHRAEQVARLRRIVSGGLKGRAVDRTRASFGPPPPTRSDADPDVLTAAAGASPRVTGTA